MLIGEIRKAGEGKPVFLELSAAEAAEVTGPATIDGIDTEGNWQNYWVAADARRRNNAPWHSGAIEPAR